MYKLKTKNIPHKDKLKCRLCGKTFQHLGSHLWHKHQVLAKEYKEEFGLPYREALISTSVYEKKRDRFEEDREKYIKNLLKNGKKFQFKKGNNGVRRVSEKERQTVTARIKLINDNNQTMKSCPVCKMKYLHLESHLFNKHKLIQVK